MLPSPGAGQSGSAGTSREPWLSQAAGDNSLQGWMSRSASWGAARVGMGWPKSGHGNHHGLLLQEQEMQLVLLSAQLPPLPAWQNPPAPQEERTAASTPRHRAQAGSAYSSDLWLQLWRWIYQLDPEREGTSQSSLAAAGAKVATLNVFAEKERKYKLGLVLQMSFPQRLQHGTPGILKEKLTERPKSNYLHDFSLHLLYTP